MESNKIVMCVWCVLPYTMLEYEKVLEKYVCVVTIVVIFIFKI